MDYIIQTGDTLFVIARRFNTTVSQLLDINPQIPDPDRVVAGEIINLPPKELCPTLREGDNGVNVRKLQRLLTDANYNPGPIDGIFSSQTRAAVLAFQQDTEILEATGIADRRTWLALGVACAPIVTIRRYVVKRSDSLFTIARGFNVSVDSIIDLNPEVLTPDLIYPGQIIKIPSR